MFIDIDFPVAVSPEQPVRIFLQHFSCDAFDDANFSRHAIHCPESIARSVLKRRAEYFYGRLCAQRVLGAAGYSDVQVLTGASREPRVSRGNRWSSREASSSGDRSLTRAAANSMAKGKPSTR